MSNKITPGSYLVTVKTQAVYRVHKLEQSEIDEHGLEGDESLLKWAINADDQLVSIDSMEIHDWERVD